MSTPRPSEADVEVLLSTHRLHASMNHCLACPWRPTAGEGGLTEQHARHLARVLSGHLAAWDAEYEREVGKLRDAFKIATESARRRRSRAEAAERALADLRGEIKALVDEWEVIGFGGVAADLRALLPRDDAAGAGGAS